MVSKPEPTADPELKPATKPMPELIFAPEPEPSRRSDQVREPATLPIPEGISVELDCLEWLINLRDIKPVPLLVSDLE